MIRFGPSGNSDSFYTQGYKSSIEMPAWLHEIGLSAYEYQCVKGVKISEATAAKLGSKAKEYNVLLSIHAPYYINLSSKEEVKRLNSIKYILDTLRAAKWMGAERIVIHPGACSGMQRKEALALAVSILKIAINEADQAGLGDIIICPETMGKINQLGDLDEVIELCLIDERLIPTLDFGHIHARGRGCLNTYEDFDKVLELVGNKLGLERLAKFHCHFSRIEFTLGGEKKHWTLDDIQYGPEFKILAQAIYNRRLSPVIICESRGTMADDALKLKAIYESIEGAKTC